MAHKNFGFRPGKPRPFPICSRRRIPSISCILLQRNLRGRVELPFAIVMPLLGKKIEAEAEKSWRFAKTKESQVYEIMAVYER
jgi:hypothetical protein